MWFGMHGMEGWWILGIIFWVALLVGIVLLVVWLVKTVSGRGRQESALDILKRRYARGEITKEEFEEKKRDLHR